SCVVLGFTLCVTATTLIFTLSLHDALPILIDVKTRQELREWLAENSATEKFCWVVVSVKEQLGVVQYLDAVEEALCFGWIDSTKDRKSTRLNSSHVKISYAVFCLKKKNKQE